MELMKLTVNLIDKKESNILRVKSETDKVQISFEIIEPLKIPLA